MKIAVETKRNWQEKAKLRDVMRTGRQVESTFYNRESKNVFSELIAMASFLILMCALYSIILLSSGGAR